LTLVVGGAIVIVSFLWAYWATIEQLIRTWNTEPDYSHGFLVPLLASFFLWNARDTLPSITLQFAWPGLLLVVLSIGLRVVAAYYYLPPIDGWSIPLWIAGVVWMLGGWPLARWCLPAIIFLYFMVPLPYRVEGWLSLPLQSVATHLSVWSLQCLGQPAIAEGHTIHLGAHRLEVEQACSGLRMLVGTVALAVAYTIIFRKTWWERVLLFASVIPIALAANIIRIAATGLLYRYVSGDAGKKFTHDFAGWLMILLAAGLFAAVLWYVRCLFPEHETVDVGELLRTREEIPHVATQPATPPG
jgi:exosortase